MNRGPKLALTGLIVAAALGVIAACILYMVRYEPWPVSMRQGPDTYFARDSLQRYLPGLDQGAVNDLYAREETTGDGHKVVTLRIGLPDNVAAQDEMIQIIVSQYSLTPLTGGEVKGTRVLPAPGWFPAPGELHSLSEVWGRGNIFLWVDRPREEETEAAATAAAAENEAPPEAPARPAHAYFQQADF